MISTKKLLDLASEFGKSEEYKNNTQKYLYFFTLITTGK